MEIPLLHGPQKYVGLYVVDFDDYAGTGFTAEEVAELLDSEKFRYVKVYKIYKAYPDGRIELKAVRHELFQLELGMFFYSDNLKTAERDYRELTHLAVVTMPPARAKVQLAKYSQDKYVVALVHPAEYNEEFSSWLLDIGYKTSGEAIGGVSAVQQYYKDSPVILKRHQLFGKSAYASRTGEELLAATKMVLQR